MNNIKKFIIPGTIALSILGSTTVFAVTSTTDTTTTITEVTTPEHEARSARGIFGGRSGKGTRMSSEERETQRLERQTERLERQEAETAILESADKLVPGASNEIETTQTELTDARDAFREEMDTLREKVESGEITREEMRESLGDKIGRKGHDTRKSTPESSERPVDAWDELQSAIETEDANAVQNALDTILAHMDERLSDMNERLASF